MNAFYKAYRALGWELDESDRMLQMFELTFDVSVVSFLYPLTLGACVYAVPQKGMKYLNVLDIMERHRLTFAAVAPSVLRFHVLISGKSVFRTYAISSSQPKPLT